MPLILAFGGHRDQKIYEFSASLACRMNYNTVRTNLRNPVLEKKILVGGLGQGAYVCIKYVKLENNFRIQKHTVYPLEA